MTSRDITMRATFLSLYYHIVFSTKNREPLLADQWRSRLHEYIGGTVKSLRGKSYGVGGVADHVHLLASLSATHTLADFVRDVKKASSIWIHQLEGEPSFGWQDGYAAFSVSVKVVPQVQNYIANQEEHHRKKSFLEEYVELLEAAGEHEEAAEIRREMEALRQQV